MTKDQQIKDAFDAGYRAGREGRALSECLTYTGHMAKPEIKAAFLRGYMKGSKGE